ncbi:hypothetical protein SAMN05444149_10952 [Pseudosulfitobacter pseudonitzschiae]|nr:hypothetical protein SAMN05444149_10952 [Pseudosulfitobacter pseudonitzschiae]
MSTAVDIYQQIVPIVAGHVQPFENGNTEMGLGEHVRPPIFSDQRMSTAVDK